MLAKILAGGLGFEPRLAESESAVLPLDDPPARRPALSLYNTSEGARAGRSGYMIQTAVGFKDFRV